MKPRLLMGAVLCGGCIAVAAQTAVPQADGLSGLRPDERRGEKALTFDLLGRPLTLGGSWDYSTERRLGFDLDRGSQRGRDVQEHEFKLDARWRAGERSTLFVQGVALAERRVQLRDRSVRETHSFERGQSWWLPEGLGGSPLALQVGRVALIERRSWWWDDDLDALRLVAEGSAGRIDTGLARELLKLSSAEPGIAPEQRGVTRWFGHATRPLAPGHQLDAFWLVHHDGSGTPAVASLHDEGREDPADARQRWLGLRASGELRAASGHRAIYRLDAALLRGRQTLTRFSDDDSGRLRAGSSRTRKLRSQALDLGLQWRLPGTARPTFSLAWARGSGGPDDAAVDRSFHQTGLQENKGRIAGVKRLRYYGELLSPELSNLRIASLGFGLRVLPNSSVELLWHHYRQVLASTTVAGSRLSVSPLGRDPRLGRELDLLFALREWQHVELTLNLSRFDPGPAFGDSRRDPAHGVELGLTVSF